MSVKCKGTIGVSELLSLLKPIQFKTRSMMFDVEFITRIKINLLYHHVHNCGIEMDILCDLSSMCQVLGIFGVFVSLFI